MDQGEDIEQVVQRVGVPEVLVCPLTHQRVGENVNNHHKDVQDYAGCTWNRRNFDQYGQSAYRLLTIRYSNAERHALFYLVELLDNFACK